MIYTQIIQALSEILQIKYEARVSGLGKIYINKYSARIQKDSGKIAPPTFKAKLEIDKNLQDHELADFLVNHYQVKRKKANRAIKNWVKVCLASKNKNSIKLVGLSDSKFVKVKSAFFQTSDAFVLTPDQIAFYPIDIQEHKQLIKEKEIIESQVEPEVSATQSLEDHSVVNDLNKESKQNDEIEVPVAPIVNLTSRPKDSNYLENQIKLQENPKVEKDLQVARPVSTSVIKPILEEEKFAPITIHPNQVEASEEVRVVPMPKEDSVVLKWIGRTAILLLFLLGAFYLFLPEGFNNLFSTNIPINQKPGYEKVLSSNREEIPKHVETEKPKEGATITQAETADAKNKSNEFESSDEKASHDSIQSEENQDFNYKIIIGRFSNERNIRQLKDRLESEGYHYFAELENGLYTIGVKVKSNPSSIHAQLQHFVDYYTWDSYFKKIK